MEIIKVSEMTSMLGKYGIVITRPPVEEGGIPEVTMKLTKLDEEFIEQNADNLGVINERSSTEIDAFYIGSEADLQMDTIL